MVAHCWEEYLWKVHKAVPVDPWATNVQLLDVLIQESTSFLWLSWLPKHVKASSLSRAGSMLTLAKKPIDNIGDANSDIRHPAQLTKSGSDNPLLNKNTPNGDTAGPTHVVNGITNRATVTPEHIHTNSDSIMELIHKALISSMPDIRASIKSSTSLLASLTGGSSASAQFDVKGSRTVTCNVVGVKSQRVDVDALMELVTCALWQPDTSLPQLQFPLKRGQTLWVVTEIMYANSIMIQADNGEKASGKTNVSKGKVAEGSEEVEVEKETVWTVTGAKDTTFPFALRLQRLKYDAQGSLYVTSNKNLKRNNSLNAKSMTSKHADALRRSSSISRCL